LTLIPENTQSAMVTAAYHDPTRSRMNRKLLVGGAIVLAITLSSYIAIQPSNLLAGGSRSLPKIQRNPSPPGTDFGDIARTFDSIPDDKEYDVCLVGAGISGTVLAERYATIMNKRSLVIDIRPHIGGNVYDYIDPDTGILMSQYGAHLFHTNSERVWKYIRKWQNRAPWVRWDHEVKGWIKGKLLPIPVNINTVNGLFGTSIRNEKEMTEWLKTVQVPCKGEASESQWGSSNTGRPEDERTGCKNGEEMAISRVGRELYEWIFKTYTKKQWDKTPDQLDAKVTARIPVRDNFDPRYFADKYQVLPGKGYTKWIAAMLDNDLIDVVLNTDYFKVRDSLKGRCGKTIFSGPIDKYFEKSGLGPLEYRSIIFQKETYFNVGPGFFQSNSVVNYPGPEVDFTRIVEYKHILQQKSDHTVIVKEFSTDKGDPYYPVPNPENRAKYKKYQQLAETEEKENGVYFVGRLASYKYFNMDAAIENALDSFNRIENSPVQADVEP